MDGSRLVTKLASVRSVGVARYLLASFVVLLTLPLPVAVANQDWSPLLAWALTFYPGLMIVRRAARFSDPRQAWPFMLYSMTLRITVAFLGGLLLVKLDPAIPESSFLLWLAGMYALALAVEVYFTLAADSRDALLRSGLPGAPSSVGLREAGR